MNNILNLYQQLVHNPVQFLMQCKLNIPQSVDTTDPNAIIQHLLNSGQVSQQQVNNAMQMRNNPMVQQLFNNSLK